MLRLNLVGLDPEQQPLHHLVAETVRDALFSRVGLPPLKSDSVLVRNGPEWPPMYCLDTIEHIRLHSPGNRPWQYAYQLAHELGHLSARADLRFPRSDGILWIEEALADCHSLIALKRMSSGNKLIRGGAAHYLRDLLTTQGKQPLYPGWYNENVQALTRADSLTEECKDVSKHIFTHVDHERILSDNRQLIELGVGTPLKEFLDRWAAMSDDAKGVPSLLRQLL